jgi:hypothetical protein
MVRGRTEAADEECRTNRNDVVAGLIVVISSLVFGAMAFDYGIGTPRQMGAGFFPLTLSAVGGILGGVVLVKAIVAPRPTDETVDIRRFLLVCAAFVVFAVSIEPGGLVLAIVATTVVGSLAHRDSKFLESLAFGVLLAVFVWLVFIQLLGLPIRAWPDLN